MSQNERNVCQLGKEYSYENNIWNTGILSFFTEKYAPSSTLLYCAKPKSSKLYESFRHFSMFCNHYIYPISDASFTYYSSNNSTIRRSILILLFQSDNSTVSTLTCKILHLAAFSGSRTSVTLVLLLTYPEQIYQHNLDIYIGLNI